MTDDIPTTVDALSLTNLGTFMLWGEINEDMSYGTCEYLIKSNIIFNRGDTVTLFINSPGGSVSEGQAIIDLMESSRVDVATRAIGQIASMGVSIFVAGTAGKRVMSKNCEVMTHQFSTMMYGKAHELMAVRKMHDDLEARFIKHFTRHTKMTERQVKEVLFGPSDTYLTAKECLAYGICDAIMDPWDLKFDSSTPKAPKSSKVPKTKEEV